MVEEFGGGVYVVVGVVAVEVCREIVCVFRERERECVCSDENEKSYSNMVRIEEKS